MKFKVLTVICCLALLLESRPAPAMAILDFGRMNLDDQSTYVADLVEGAAKILRASGHPDQAQKTIDLFKDSSKHGGLSQFAQNMKTMYSANVRHEQNPNNRVPDSDVEAAMQATLAQNGINVPLKSLETINHGFHPFYPLH